MYVPAFGRGRRSERIRTVVYVDCEETGRRYIAYTDNRYTYGCTRVFASVCAADGDKLRLLAIETEREWELLDTVLQQVHEEALAEDDCDDDP